MTRYLVGLTYPEAVQVIEALTNRADSMRHRVTIGLARLEDVQSAIVDCAAAETAVRDAVGLDRQYDDDYALAAKLGTYDVSEGESFDPIDVPLALTPDPGDWYVRPTGSAA
jgi:hypothetical protein